MRNLKKILALTFALTTLATPITSLAATPQVPQARQQEINVETENEIVPLTDVVFFEKTDLLNNGQSHTWGDFYLVGGCTYQLEVYLDNSGPTPYQVKIYGTWTEHTGYYSNVVQASKPEDDVFGIVHTFTAPYDGYFNFTVTNQALSPKSFWGALSTNDF